MALSQKRQIDELTNWAYAVMQTSLVNFFTEITLSEKRNAVSLNFPLLHVSFGSACNSTTHYKVYFL